MIKKIVLFLLGLIFVLILLVVISLQLIYRYHVRDLPKLGSFYPRPQTSFTLYDRDNKLIHEEKPLPERKYVKWQDIPQLVKQATIAIEDADFYNHRNFSFMGFIRELIRPQSTMRGGSTITQLVVKNLLLNQNQRNVSRHIKEFTYSIEIESKYSKDEILETYLNESYYGENYYGIHAAAKGYFGKELKDITLLESAFLAGVRQLPRSYSPFNGTVFWLMRTQAVLKRMHEDGYITTKEYEQAVANSGKITFIPQQKDSLVGDYVEFIKDELKYDFSPTLFNEKLTIKATLSLEKQQEVYTILKEQWLPEASASAVIIDKSTNDLVVMVNINSHRYLNEKLLHKTEDYIASQQGGKLADSNTISEIKNDKGKVLYRKTFVTPKIHKPYYIGDDENEYAFEMTESSYFGVRAGDDREKNILQNIISIMLSKSLIRNN